MTARRGMRSARRRIIGLVAVAVICAGALAVQPLRRRFGDAAPGGAEPVTRARLMAIGGDLGGAERLLREELSAGRPSADVHALLGLIALQSGRAAEAEASFRAALAQAPGHVAACLELASMQLRRGEADAALATMAAIRKSAQCPASLHMLAARAELARGDVAESLAALEAASALAPSDPEPCIAAAVTAEFLGRTEWSRAADAKAAHHWAEAARRARPVAGSAGVGGRRAAQWAASLLAQGDTKAALGVLQPLMRPEAALDGPPELRTELVRLHSAARVLDGDRRDAESELVALWTDPPDPALVAARATLLAWTGEAALARGIAASSAAASAAAGRSSLDTARDLDCYPEKVTRAADLLAPGLARVTPLTFVLDGDLRAAAANGEAGALKFGRVSQRCLRVLAALASGETAPVALAHVRRELAELAARPELTLRVTIAQAALDVAAGRGAEALRRLEEPAVTRADPAQAPAELRFVRALAYESAGRFREAAEEAALAAAERPRDTVRIAVLIRCLAAAGDVQSAKVRAEEALASHFGDPWIDSARGSIDEIAKSSAGWRADLAAMAEAGAILERPHVDDAALARAEELIAGVAPAGGRTQRIAGLHAMLLLRRGDDEGAAERAREALRADPGDAFADGVLRTALSRIAAKAATGPRTVVRKVDEDLRTAAALAALRDARGALDVLAGAPDDDDRVLRARAAILAGAGDLARARESLAALLGRSPGDARARLLLARVLDGEGDAQAAAREFRTLVERACRTDADPRALPALVEWGADAAFGLLASGAAGEADVVLVERFVEAQLMAGDREWARTLLGGAALVVRGRPDEALKPARNLAAAAPGSQYPHLLAAMAAERVGDLRTVRLEAGRALTADPSSLLARRIQMSADLRLGVAAYLRGDVDGAQVSLERAACSGGPLDSVAAILLAQIHVRRGDADATCAAQIRLTEGARREFVPPLFRGLVARSGGRTDEALSAFGAALAAAPDHPIPLCAAVTTLAGAGRHDEAAALCAERLQRRRGAPGIVEYLAGTAAEGAGRTADAEARYREALAASPGSPTYVSAIVRLLAASGRADEARAILASPQGAFRTDYVDVLPALARVLAATAAPDPDVAARVLAEELADFTQPSVRIVDRAELHVIAGDTDGAEARLSEAIRLAPDSFRAHRLLGHLLWKSGRLKAAAARYEAEAASRPEDPLPPALLGMIAEANGDPAAAERWYRRSLDVAPAFAVPANNLACLLTSQPEHRREALRLAGVAAAGAPSNPVVLDTLGWLLHLTGDSEGALRAISRAARSRPDAAIVRYHEAEVLATAGRDADARAAFAACRKADPALAESLTPSEALKRVLESR